MSDPLEVLATLDGIPQIPFRIVGILTADLVGFFVCELLLPMPGQEVALDVRKLALAVALLEDVASVAMIAAPSLRRAVVAEEHETDMVRLGCVGEEVKQIVVQQEVLWVALLGADHIGPLNWITTKTGVFSPTRLTIRLLLDSQCQILCL